MAYTIKDGCHDCDRCWSECLKGAIKPSEPQAEYQQPGYWIDPTLCDACPDVEIPYCVQVCDSDTSLKPLPSRKGRCKSTLLPPAIPGIFLNGKTTPFASCMVIWEACTVFSNRQLLAWHTDASGRLCYHRSVNRGRGEMRFRLAVDPEIAHLERGNADRVNTDTVSDGTADTAVDADTADTTVAEVPLPMSADLGREAIARFDIRATCIHLIFAAYAATLNCPWEESFELNDQHIEKYLGLDKRKDLTKLEKLTLIKELVYQSCRLLVSLDWPQQGKVRPFTLTEQPVWHLRHTQYYFEKDAQGCQHLIGLSFTIRAGGWAQRFLNSRDYRNQTAFYQYGTLPRALIAEVMSSWQQHEGAVRLLLWLLFKLRLGGDHRLTVRTLLRVAYGEHRLLEATTVRGAHKRLLKTFENDLQRLYCHGLEPIFDPETYPIEIQPLWAKAARIPDDVDEALDFWADEANRVLTDNAPKDKWQRLLNARILGFELSDEWQQSARRPVSKRRRRPPSKHYYQSRSSVSNQGAGSSQSLSGLAIKAAREQQKITQRALASSLGKSQSWIRDVEKGRFSISFEDQVRLREALGIQ
ncbi:Helix-turn-helix domain protein [Synechococcus sp. PCC 7335]|uniref:helix-turn-helix domain-containing protein n=1 Tax=Synechococcus sp. (strain ATCC 29403 / PCC 7335) TaxID=91464 RepID=UPI00017ECB38|nr:helix-turn-helix domain-containing protein [Synechococcus sp. PCC 7335]EDX85440.1 Helix-turn-helix domain protein [Synechococcus sp. PCC 7335]